MRKLFIRLFCLLSIYALFISNISIIYAQNKDSKIHGTVKDEQGNPLEFASIVLGPSGQYTTTDSKGGFQIDRIHPGKIEVLIQYYGMQDWSSTYTLKAGDDQHIDAILKETSFRLENVIVTATKSNTGSSTASKISRQAMDHLQTSSLMDIMTLLPGVELSNPSLNKATSISVRDNVSKISSGSSAARSLGTAVIVDGAPLSNNANMQVLSSSIAGNLQDYSGSASAGEGVDVRMLSTDNIESVEIIRGIPSVEYGDMTSGAVLVKSKAGKSPLTIRFKANPNIYQLSTAKGMRLGKNFGDLNISGDYAYNRNELVKDYKTYQRAGLKGLWSFMRGNFTENTSLTLIYGRDRAKLNPDAYGKEQSWANSAGLQFNTNGNVFINRGWMKSINWILSGSYTNKVSHYESTASNALNLYSTAMSNGVTYTNIPGLDVFDTDTGERITNNSGTEKGVILPYSYFYVYDIFGDEINVFAKLNTKFSKTWNGMTDKLLLGADFKTDGNLGKGPVYDDDFPPFRNVGNASSGYRRRNYYDIPFVNQLGLYGENILSCKVGERVFSLSTGLRYDMVNSLHILAPRLNTSADIFPWMTLRAGWGITGKAPTAMYLYPNDAYLDAINFNGMNVSLPESERLLIATTTIYNAGNPDLKIAKNRKAEAGMDITIAKKYRINLTVYDEYMKNGYAMGLGLPSFVWYQHDIYKEKVHNTGKIPSVSKDTTFNLFFNVYKPYNNVITRSRGIEYEIDLGRFKAIRTSFNINGAWSYGSSTNGGYYFNMRPDSKNTERNIGIYNPQKETRHYENLLTTLRVTHNIPQIGFVITLTAQANWYGKFWSTYKNDEMLIGYLSRKDGKYHDFDPSMKNDPEFSYLFPTLTDKRFIVNSIDPYFTFNLNITKEIKNYITASFYVNNIFNHRHLDRYESSGVIDEYGIPIFFGFELKVNIH